MLFELNMIGLKIQCPLGRTGSSPVFSTKAFTIYCRGFFYLGTTLGTIF